MSTCKTCQRIRLFIIVGILLLMLGLANLEQLAI